MEQRAYQERALARLPLLLRQHRKVVVVGPTGCGKTVVGARMVRARPGRTLWVAHRIELVRQARDELQRSGVAQVGILTGAERSDEAAPVLVASVGMFQARPVPDVSFIVLDEAHRATAASYQRIIDSAPNAEVLGLTATPWRLDGQPLGDVFEELDVMAEPLQLMADGYLASPVVYGIPRERARELVRGLRRTRGDYAEADLAEAMSTPTLIGDMVSEKKRLANGLQTIVFAVNRKHAASLHERYSEAGFAAEYLDGETPERERQAMLARLRDGATEIVVNVDVLSEGFDCPPVKCVVLARPTRSLTRFLQQIGRGLRPHGDRRPMILDHAGNTWRFGLPGTPREWSLDGKAKAHGTGDAPVRCCPTCSAMVAIGAPECPECGESLRAPLEDLEDASELERIEADQVARARCRVVLERIAQERGADRAWPDQVLSKLFGEAHGA